MLYVLSRTEFLTEFDSGYRPSADRCLFYIRLSRKDTIRFISEYSFPFSIRPFFLRFINISFCNTFFRRSQWPRGLRRGSATVRLLELWVRIPLRTWMPVSFVYCVLSGRGLCVGLITRLEESYWVWYVWMCSWSLDNEEAVAHYGMLRHWKTTSFHYFCSNFISSFFDYYFFVSLNLSFLILVCLDFLYTCLPLVLFPLSEISRCAE
jgi:hypothetical protein